MNWQLRHSITILCLSLSLPASADTRDAAAKTAAIGAMASGNQAAMLGAAAASTDDKKMQMMLMMMMMQQQMQAQADKKAEKDNKKKEDDKKAEDSTPKVPQPKDPDPKAQITPVKPDEENLVMSDAFQPKKDSKEPLLSTGDGKDGSTPSFVPSSVSTGEKGGSSSTADTKGSGEGFAGGAKSMPQALPTNTVSSAAAAASNSGQGGGGGGSSSDSGIGRYAGAPTGVGGSSGSSGGGTAGEAEAAGDAGRGAKGTQGSAGGGGGGDEGGSSGGSGGGGSAGPGEDFFNMLSKGPAATEDASLLPGDPSRDITSEDAQGPGSSPEKVINIFQIAQVRYQYAAIKEKRILAHAR